MSSSAAGSGGCAAPAAEAMCVSRAVATPSRAAPTAAVPLWRTPVAMAALVVPSLAVTPALWLAVAGHAAGGAAVAAQATAIAGLIFSLAGASAVSAYALAHHEPVRTVRIEAAITLVLSVLGAILAALSVALAGSTYVAVLTVGVTLTSLLALACLAA